MGNVEVTAQDIVEHGKEFPVDVTVTGAEPNADVDITLKQTHGLPPLWGPETQTKRANSDGTAHAAYQVRLEGPTVATLLGTADDGSTFFKPGTKSVEVT